MDEFPRNLIQTGNSDTWGKLKNNISNRDVITRIPVTQENTPSVITGKKYLRQLCLKKFVTLFSIKGFISA